MFAKPARLLFVTDEQNRVSERGVYNPGSVQRPQGFTLYEIASFPKTKQSLTRVYGRSTAPHPLITPPHPHCP